MTPRRLYLLLFLAGVLVPYIVFAPWVAENGLNLGLMFQQLFANRVGAFFGADVLVCAVVVFAFTGMERKRMGSGWWLPVVAVLLAGVSAGLPLLLYLREGRQPVSVKESV